MEKGKKGISLNFRSEDLMKMTGWYITIAKELTYTQVEESNIDIP